MTPEDFLVWGGSNYSGGSVMIVCPTCSWRYRWTDITRKSEAPTMWLMHRTAKDHLIQEHDS